VDNLNDQTSGLTLTIISATNTPVGGWPIFTSFIDGSGFDVTNGQVTGVDISYVDPSFTNTLQLGNQGNYSPTLGDSNMTSLNAEYNSASTNSLVFSPVSSAAVPGPLPLLGAAAAFGWSRQLRRRIKISV
jgi:hypothetical protein